MSQLLTLLWLKWRLLRNSLRSSKAVLHHFASLLGFLFIFAFALATAIGLGFLAYFVSKPGVLSEAFRHSAARQVDTIASVELVFFLIFSFLYLMWTTVPLSFGASRQFDAGRMLMYPISLKKLFAIDLLSEVTTLSSLFGIPSIVAVGIGTGLSTGKLFPPLFAILPAAVFGMSLSKWVGISIGSLVQRKRARGETIIALVGAIAGLGGALAGQLGPAIFRHADQLRFLRWTPPGAVASLLVSGKDPVGYSLSFALLCFYSALVVFLTYWIARRAALGIGGPGRRKKAVSDNEMSTYTGWQVPLASPQLAAIIEKELRYAMRNAQLRMMGLMPFILIVIRWVQSQRVNSSMRSGGSGVAKEFLTYTTGWLATGGVLYVFLLLAGWSCNLFAFEEGGIRTLVLSPISRKTILLGKNIAVTTVLAVFSSLLLLVNAIVFRDFSPKIFLFAGLSFVIFACLMALIGNWFSISFPKRMQYGKRLNVSGMAGLLLLPLLFLLVLPPLVATLVGFLLQSFLIEFAILGLFALAGIGFYVLLLNYQGRYLERREIQILEAIREPGD